MLSRSPFSHLVARCINSSQVTKLFERRMGRRVGRSRYCERALLSLKNAVDSISPSDFPSTVLTASFGKQPSFKAIVEPMSTCNSVGFGTE